MPKIITAAMRAHLDQETTRLCTAWRIERRDGQSFYFCELMLHPRGRPQILDAPGQALGRAEAGLDLRQEQNTAVRGQPPGVERDLDGLAGDG